MVRRFRLTLGIIRRKFGYILKAYAHGNTEGYLRLKISPRVRVEVKVNVRVRVRVSGKG